MSAIVRETSEYVEMSDSITLCIVKDGAAGTSINMKTGVSSPDALPSSGASIGDSYIIDGHLWTYTGGTASDATHRNGFTDCGKVSGEAGKNNYVHVAWSNKQKNHTIDDIVLSNTDGNAYAYMGTWVSETKEDTADEAVKMAKWVYVKGDKGTPGKDAVTYGVQVTPYLDPLSSGKTDPGIQIHFTRTTGATVETFTNVTKLGGLVMVYVDGVYHVDATEWINGGNDKIVFSHFPIDNTSTDKTLGTASTIGIELLVNSTVVATASYANGKQGADGKGALEIICDPETIVLDTDDNGLVKDYSNAWAGLMCVRDGKVVDNVTYNIGEHDTVNCEATVNNNGIVTITSVDSQTVTIDGSTVTVSSTSGSVTVNVTEDATGVTYTKTVPFAVNVARYTGGLKADNKKLQSQYSLLTNNGTVTDLKEYKSEILQTAKEISLKVSEKSVGRRNLLPGSAFRKGDDGFEMGIYGDFDGSTYTKGYHGNQGIFMNGGVSGSNFFRAKSYYDGSNPQYGGLFWKGGGASKNIKVQANKKYALSCWVKCDRTDVTISLETIYKASETTTTRQGRPFTTPNYFHVSKANTWQLISCIVTTDGSFNYVEVNFWVSHMINGVTATACFCHPMFEEAEEYNGWTLSELDYDYIGGNLIDNSRTFASGGNCNVHTTYGSVIANVYNSESSVFKARMEALAGSVPSKYSLPSSASSGTRYALDSDWSVWQYNGNSLSDDSHYNGWQKTNESLHQDIMLVNLNLELNKDYIISWYAKCEGNGFFGAYATDVGKTVYSEYSDGGIDQSTNGENIFFLTTQWKRFWMHVKLIKGSCSAIAFRQYRGDWSSGSSAMTVYFTQPKIEEGATVTDWTEKRTDMVDKQALYATGIDIENKKIVATADNFVVRNNRGEPTFSVDVEGNIVGSGGASFNGPMKATTFTLNSKYFSVMEDGTITAKGGQISFFYFDEEGMASAVEYDSSQNKPWRGIGLSSNNISVSGYTGQRISSVFLGKGLIDSRFAGSDKNYIVHRVGSTSSASTFYNYIKLERFEDGHDSYENDPEYAALGIETQGDFCLAALGGPSLFAGMCFASDTGGSFVAADKKHCFYLCSGGTFYMPSDPPDGMLIVVIQTRDRIDFNAGNGHSFKSGSYNNQSFTSNSAGQWSLFYYNNGVWYTIYMTR